MSKSRQNDHLYTELDADLLRTPFGVQTKWHVITGTLSSGKSTLIEQIAEQGFKTVPETARRYIDSQVARGRTIEEVRGCPTTLQRGVNEMMLRIELGLPVKEVLFLDRAFPDALAFSRANGVNPNEILADCFHRRYLTVFLLERFPVEQDGVRYHDDAAADLIESWHTRDYRSLGYEVVRVPVLAPDERLAFVLDKLSERELI
jgi:predicted ATPase